MSMRKNIFVLRKQILDERRRLNEREELLNQQEEQEEMQNQDQNAKQLVDGAKLAFGSGGVFLFNPVETNQEVTNKKYLDFLLKYFDINTDKTLYNCLKAYIHDRPELIKRQVGSLVIIDRRNKALSEAFYSIFPYVFPMPSNTPDLIYMNIGYEAPKVYYLN